MADSPIDSINVIEKDNTMVKTLIFESSEILEFTDLQNVNHEHKVKKTFRKKSKPAKPDNPRVVHYFANDISNIASYVFNMNKFMAFHPEMFKTNVSKKMIYINDNQIYNVYLEPVYFKDTIHNVKGFIETRYNNISNSKSSDNKSENQFTMIVNIRTSLRDLERCAYPCYIKQIEQYINERTRHGDIVELHYNKILTDTIIKHCYYNQPVEQWLNDVKILQDEFFLPNRDSLLAIMNNKANSNSIGNMSTSWNNLMLYGPPGSGKSSYIYRISVTLKMSILSVDLSLYLNKKKELYALFHGQEFCLPNSTNKESSLSNYIIVLEEFDTAVEKILDIENIFKYKDILKRNYLDLKNKELQSKAQTYIKKSSESHKGSKIESKELKKKESHTEMENINYEDFMEKMMLEDGVDTKNNKLLDSMRADLMEQREHGNEMHSINAELNNIITSMDDDNKSNILRANDLKELFQSPAPVKGRLIIANTNNYEKIKDAIPALFRAGRMTPVPFGNLDWHSLNQLTMYYFQRTMGIAEFKITIPTSEITELAIKYILTKHSFDEFELELKALCI